MPLSAGTKLGPYEIVSPLGAGGMGEVYRARDTRLGREVAVKILPESLAGTPEARARFEREARAVAALNHPHICVLHDVGREGSIEYLVMELVEGESLAQRLAKGALTVEQTLKLGSEIADALDRAHRAGIIHRDLKPGNVMLSKGGAKLMDFGLARPTGMAGPARGSGATMAALTASPTMAQPLTSEGTLIGTYQYMSPEQLEGHEADARSDIWALGCVLYEMATGRRAFEGKSQASLISSIMKDEVKPVSQVTQLAPPGLDRLVQSCLSKDPEERWQSAGDVRRELDWLRGASSSSGGQAAPAAVPVARKQSRTWLPAAIAAAVAALATAVFLLGPWHADRAPGQLMRFSLGAPAGATVSTPAEAALSPDGAMLAFVAFDSVGTNRIYVRSFASMEPRVVPGSEKGALPFWAPDGKSLAFFSDGKLRKVALDGTTPVVLCDAIDPRGGSWSRDGVILFTPNNQGPISQVSENGGTPTVVTKLDAGRHELGHRYPQFLPDGKHFLYVAIAPGDGVSTFAVGLDGKNPVEVCRAGTGGRFAEPGYLIFLDATVGAQHRRLLARRFDPGSLRTSGEALLVLNEVNANNFGYSNVTVDQRGNLLVQHWNQPLQNFDWWDRTGKSLGSAVRGLDANGSGNPTLSPDGLRLAYGGLNPPDLYVRDLRTGVSTRITFEGHEIAGIVWSSDGRRIAFSRLMDAHRWEVYVKAADGSGAEAMIFRSPGLFSYAQSWSRDGRWIVALGSNAAGNYDLWRVPMAGQGSPEPYQKTSENELGASISPDGKWLAYVVDENGRRATYVQSFPEPGDKAQLTVEDPVGGLWTDKGDGVLVFDSKGGISQVDVSTVAGFHQGETHRLFHVPAGVGLSDVERGEKRFLVNIFDPRSINSSFELVQNWTRLLEKK